MALIELDLARRGAVVVLAVFFMSVDWVQVDGSLPLIGVDNIDSERVTPGKDHVGNAFDLPGCRLGERFYDLDDTWSPELEPVGVMYCVVCQCQPVIKKGVLQRRGKVACRNIKHDCPSTPCSHPQIAPGHCCKLCPGQDPVKAFGQSRKRFPTFRLTGSLDSHIASAPKTGTKPSKAKEYLAILVGKSRFTNASTSAVARGHFTLRSSALYFSISYNGTERPAQIRILDHHGSVLYLHDVTSEAVTSHPSGDEYMICGIWQPLAKVYTRFLNHGRLVAVLTTANHDNGFIAGKIDTHRALNKETFSALLRPEAQAGSGGVAMMTIGGDGGVNFIVRLVGMSSNSGRPSTVTVTFEKDARVLHETSGELLGTEQEFAEVWSGLGHREWRMMARGAVVVKARVPGGSAPLSGIVTPRKTCNVLLSVLSRRAVSSPRPGVADGAAGSALLALGPAGSLSYSLHLVGVQSKVTEISIETNANKRGRTKRMCRLTASYHTDPSSFDGWANGTCDRLHSRHIHALLQGEMNVKVVTQKHPDGALRGPITELLYNANINKHSDTGVVLAGSSMRPPVTADVAGQAWFTVDSACAVHYDLVLSGLAEGEEDAVLTAQLFATISPTKVSQGTSNITFTLSEFVGNGARASVTDLPPQLFSHLSDGTLLIRITSKAQPSGVLAAQVHVPNSCGVREEKSHTLEILDDQQELPAAQDVTWCRVDGVTYNDGDTWVPNGTHSCTTCSCKRGREECHATICPRPTCRHPTPLDGDCCPQCLDGNVTTKKCFFDGDKRWHRYGTKWHPYMPPFGYMTCAVCMCSDGPSPVNCTRPKCPALDCPESAAVRLRPTDCCKVCPVEVKSAPTLAPGEAMQGDIVMEGSCPFRGERYANGATWNPYVQPFGRLACVTCRCLSGSTKCQRQKCPKLTCLRRVRTPDMCCPVCEAGIGTAIRRRRHKDIRQKD